MTRRSFVAFLGALGAMVGCAKQPPAATPDQFESMTEYWWDIEDRGAPEPSVLAAPPHWGVGPERARRLFAETRELGSRPFYWGKGGTYLGVVRLKGGGECRIAISRLRCFRVEGGRYYAFLGASKDEYDVLAFRRF